MNRFSFSLTFFLLISLFGIAQTETDSIIIKNFKWEETVLGKGIVNKHGIFTDLYGGVQNVNITVIDLKEKSYKTKIIMPDTCDLTSEMAKSNNAIVAINGSFYNEKTFKSTCFYRVNKKTEHITTDKEFGRVNGAVELRKGQVDLILWDKSIENKYKKNNRTVLSSGPMLVYDKQICDFSWLTFPRFTYVKHPRSAIALADNQLWLITVDGRLPGYADGMTIPELAHMLKILGSKKALNLDGGRSTTLWAASAPENGVLNAPAANKKFDSYGERLNSNTIIVCE
jgi:exopolysaccharide biosynthesis protein